MGYARLAVLLWLPHAIQQPAFHGESLRERQLLQLFWPVTLLLGSVKQLVGLLRVLHAHKSHLPSTGMIPFKSSSSCECSTLGYTNG